MASIARPFPDHAKQCGGHPGWYYVKGEITRVQRAGRIKGTAEILFNFNTMIFPNGYTVDLPGDENQSRADNASVTDEERHSEGRQPKRKRCWDGCQDGSHWRRDWRCGHSRLGWRGNWRSSRSCHRFGPGASLRGDRMCALNREPRWKWC